MAAASPATPELPPAHGPHIPGLIFSSWTWTCSGSAGGSSHQSIAQLGFLGLSSSSALGSSQTGILLPREGFTLSHVDTGVPEPGFAAFLAAKHPQSAFQGKCRAGPGDVGCPTVPRGPRSFTHPPAAFLVGERNPLSQLLSPSTDLKGRIPGDRLLVWFWVVFWGFFSSVLKEMLAFIDFPSESDTCQAKR